jgi:Ca2+-binding RTX toxin-like protein
MAYVNVASGFVIGSADADTLDASAWNQATMLLGGAGNDTYILSRPDQNVGEDSIGGTDTVIINFGGVVFGPYYYLGANLENLAVAAVYDSGTNPDGFALVGNDLANIITGSDAIRDLLTGEYLSTGRDTIIGGFGADRMIGGTGGDAYYVDNVGDVVVETAGTPAGIGGEGPGASLYDQIYYDYVNASVSYVLPANVEGLFLQDLSQALTATGNASDNDIQGNQNDNKITGLGGNDFLSGMAGKDTVDGGDGNDELYGDSTDGSETPDAGVLYDDTLIGGAGNDKLHGGLGKDTLTGGVGNDTYYLDGANDVATKSVDTVVEAAAGGDDTVYAGLNSYVLPVNVENLFFVGAGSFAGTGNASNNRIEGGNGNDILTGLAGNDTLIGGGGIDTLTGGTGDDTYHVDSPADIVIEKAGEGTDFLDAEVPFNNGNPNDNYYVLPDNVEGIYLHPVYLGGGIDHGPTDGGDAYGNALNNVMVGNSQDNKLVGGAGNDRLEGRGGDDILIGGAGDDTFVYDATSGFTTVIERAGEGTDTIRVRGDVYDLWSNVENVVQTDTSEEYLAGIQMRSVFGNGLNNRLEGGDGSDYLSGFWGNDVMVGKKGDDTYVVQQAGDVITELANEGTDMVGAEVSYTLGANLEWLELRASAGNINGTGNAVNNRIWGNAGNNTLSGLGGNDELYGGAGNDTLIGGDGNDILEGGFGSDTLNGGLGNDTYLYVEQRDTVLADPGGMDKILLVFGGFTATPYDMASGIENLEMVSEGARNVNGNASDNVIKGNAMRNAIAGGAGNDTLDGGAGADSLTGGTGNDTYVVDDPNDFIQEIAGEGTDTVIASAGNTESDPGLFNIYLLGNTLENLTLAEVGIADIAVGNAAANVVTGNSTDNYIGGMGGNDTLIGGGGDDELDGADILNPDASGASGLDVLRGGTGDDSYYVDYTGAAPDTVTENANEGSDVVVVAVAGTGTALSYTLPANVEDVLVLNADAVLSGDPPVFGNASSRVTTVTGSAADNWIVTMAGNQTLNGLAGNDHLIGGAGNDAMVGGAGDDEYWVDSGDGAASVTTGTGEDQVTEAALGGTDTVVIVGDLANYVLPNEVENLVVGGAGIVLETADLLGADITFTGVTTPGGNFAGNALANVITVDATVAVAVFGAAGNDTVNRVDSPLAVNDDLNGGAGVDTLNVGVNGFSGNATAGGFETVNLHNLGVGASNWAGIGAADTGTTPMTLNLLGDGTNAVEGNLTLTNLPGNLLLAASAITVSDYFDSNPGVLSIVQLGLTGTSGANDALKLGLSDADLKLVMAGVETLNLNTHDGHGLVDVSGVSGATQINVSGDSEIDITGIDAVNTTIGIDNFSGTFAFLEAAAPGSTLAIQVGSVSMGLSTGNVLNLSIETTQATLDPAIPVGEALVFLENDTAAMTVKAVVGQGSTLHLFDVDASTLDLGAVEGGIYVNTTGDTANVTFDADLTSATQTGWHFAVFNTQGETDTFNFDDSLPRWTFINDSVWGDSDVLNANISDAVAGGGATPILGFPGDPRISGIETINFSLDAGATATMDGSQIYTDTLNVSGGDAASSLAISELHVNFFDARTFGGTLDISFGSTGGSLVAVGSNQADTLVSIGGGDDLLAGRQGQDSLWGGEGADTFFFGEDGAANADTVWDFRTAVDIVELDGNHFNALNTGAVSQANFVVGTGALDGNDFLIFNDVSGDLFYDADGSGAGAQQQIANFGVGATVAATDFSVII